MRDLTSSERNYLHSRLIADEITNIPSLDVLTGIPIVISDREILDVYEKADARVSEAIKVRPIQMLLPDRAAPAMHVAAPNWRDKWAWIGIGVGTTLSIQVTMLLVYAWVVTR